jgi:dienelactone hydrolase
MTYTFAFSGGFKDGMRVSTDSPDPTERVVAEYFRAATRRGKVGRVVVEAAEVPGGHGQTYEVAEKIETDGYVLVKCVCREIPAQTA